LSFRAKAVCKPEKWQVVLGKTIGFFKDGIPNFFTATIPDVFVNKIGGGIIDVGKDIGSFFKDTIGGGLEDFGKTIGTGDYYSPIFTLILIITKHRILCN